MFPFAAKIETNGCNLQKAQNQPENDNLKFDPQMSYLYVLWAQTRPQTHSMLRDVYPGDPALHYTLLAHPFLHWDTLLPTSSSQTIAGWISYKAGAATCLSCS